MNSNEFHMMGQTIILKQRDIINLKEEGFYFLKSGEVEIYFATKNSDGKITDKRYFSDFKEDSYLFCVPAEIFSDEVLFYGKCEKDTEIIKLSFDDLGILELDDELGENVYNGILVWFEGLSRRVNLRLPNIFNSLESIIHNKDNVFEFNRSMVKKLYLKYQQIIKREREHIKKRFENDKDLLKKSFDKIDTSIRWRDREEVGNQRNEEDLVAAIRQILTAIGRKPSGEVEGVPDIPVEDKIQYICDVWGVGFRKVRLQGDWWKKDNGPLLVFHGENKKPHAAIPAHPDSYKLHDGQNRVSLYANEELASKIHEEAYMFYAIFPEDKINLKELIRLGISNIWKRDLVKIVLVNLIMSLLGIAVPVATSILFNFIIPERDFNNLLIIACIFTACLVSMTIFHMIGSVLVIRINWKMDAAVEAAMWDRALKFSPQFYKKISPIILSSQAQIIGGMLSSITNLSIKSMIGLFNLIFNLGLMFYFNATFGFFVLVLMVIYLLVTFLLGFIKSKFSKEFMKISLLRSATTYQLVCGVHRIAGMNAINRFYGLWMKDRIKSEKIYFKSKVIKVILHSVNTSFSLLAMMILFYIYAKTNGNYLSVGNFIAFFAAFNTFILTLISTSESLIKFLDIKHMYEVSRGVLDECPEKSTDGGMGAEISGNLELNNVGFRYKGSNKDILTDINISIKSGETIGITGPEASGKTTLVSIISGLLKPSTGKVYYDGRDLENINKPMFWRKLAYVPQNISILPGSLRSVLKESVNSVDDEKLLNLAKDIDFYNDIKNFSQELETYIYEDGNNLTHSQKAKVMLLKALIKKSNLLIADDYDRCFSESLLNTVNSNLKKGNFTKLLISKKIDTLRLCDKIYFMEDGRIVESGNFKELMQEGKRFFSYFNEK